MEEPIRNQLAEIETECGVRVLYACESGSRAWGFASADSDWDVRFFYVHPVEWYLTIRPGRDVIEPPIVDELDFTGWDLRKALELFYKSNPPLLEWLRSPIVYWEEFSTARRLRDLVKTYFSPKSCVFHYLSMAAGNYKKYLRGESVKHKKYFYVLRPILAAMWILDRDEAPPMEFQALLDALVKDGSIRGAVQDLLARKKSGGELAEGPRIPVLNDFIEERLAGIEARAEESRVRPKPGLGELDALFRETLEEVWG